VSHLVSVLVPVAVERPYTYTAEAPLAPGTIVAAPLGPRQVIGVVVPDAPDEIPPKKLKSVAGIFDAPPLPPDLLAFIAWVADYTLVPRGMVMRMVLRTPGALAPEPATTQLRLGAKRPERMTEARSRVIAAAEAPGRGTWTKATLARAAEVSGSVIDGLVADGTLETVSLAPPVNWQRPDPRGRILPLSPEQARAGAELAQRVKEGGFSATLLDGVTGAGKTEAYFEAVAAALEAGRQVLVLMPEIALTAAFRERFAARFGAPPVEWHSELNPKERRLAWRAVATGEVQVVVGARSALYLPFPELGLIVVDEEHDTSYKQDDGVTYHARDMAVVRAHLGRFPIILASATPSVESIVNVEAGRYACVRLGSRFGDAATPAIAAIDMRKEGPDSARFLSPPLVNAVTETLDRGEQALLFLNRRGFAPLTLCRTCGHRLGCPNCSAWLVEHRFRGVLACHHCGHEARRPRLCPRCETPDSLAPCGPGIERIQEETVSRFPHARTLVLSSDLGVDRLRRELAAIRDGEADIVIGTQLVAKGHNFPNLTLVGIVDADIGLDTGDPRASERSFQLLTQVTGRAGRTGKPSRGLIQTYQPDHPVMQALVAGDRDRFYETEVAIRRRGLLPPFGRLAIVHVSAPARASAEDHARALAKAAPPASDVRLLGPAEAPMAVLRGRHRFRLLVQAKGSERLHAFLRAWVVQAPKARGGVRVDVDIDPYSFL